MTFSADAVFVRSSEPLATEIDGDLVMMDAVSGTYFNLDRIGSDIWARLATETRLEDLCRDLATIYDAPLDTIRRDIAALLSQMLEHRLVAMRTP